MKRHDFKIKQDIGFKVYDCHSIKYDDCCTRIFVVIDGNEHRVLPAYEELSDSLIERICMAFIYAYEIGKNEGQTSSSKIFKKLFNRGIK
jgi:hypothetical protein